MVFLQAVLALSVHVAGAVAFVLFGEAHFTVFVFFYPVSPLARGHFIEKSLASEKTVLLTTVIAFELLALFLRKTSSIYNSSLTWRNYRL